MRPIQQEQMFSAQSTPHPNRYPLYWFRWPFLPEAVGLRMFEWQNCVALTGRGVRSARRRRDSFSSLDDEKPYKSRGEDSVTLEPDPQEVRRIRLERLERRADATVGRAASTSLKMTSESHATIPSSRTSSSQRRRRDHHRSQDEHRHRRGRESTTQDENAGTYVYGPPRETLKSPDVIISETRVLGRDGQTSESSESEEEHSTRSRTTREQPKERKIKVVYVAKADTKPIKHKEHRIRDSSDRIKSSEPIRRTSTHHSHRKSVSEAQPVSPLKRYGDF